MQIITLSDESAGRLRSLVPGRMCSPRHLLLGCLIDDELCGAAALERMEERCDLSWLWVREDRRRQGAGNALLEAACNLSAEKLGLPLTVCYSAQEPSAPVFDYALSKHGFALRSRRLPRYSVSRQSLENTPLMEAGDDGMWGSCIFPLQSLRGDQINRFRLYCEETGIYQASRADFAEMDQKLSLALAEQGRISAVSLQRRLSESASVLELLYIKNADAVRGMAFLRETARRTLGAGIERTEFVCVTEPARRLASRLLGQPESFVGISSGVLDIGMYRKGGRRNEQ